MPTACKQTVQPELTANKLVQRQALILGLPPLKRLVKPELQRWLTLILSVDRALEA